MSEWIAVGALKDMPENVIIPFSHAAEDYILIRRGDEVTAFVDLCSHQEIKLSEFGEIQQGVLICHAHGAAFDCHDGKELCFPATSPLQNIPTRLSAGQVELYL
ncbi:MAG TPA: Rieske 2Fe-2S domain-containing protein [Oligoflexus sp.]|uniref:Rieske (2Fe-2S) protein n=1 Tax=Oligoflexus sp. TaxID=1971216 RepID=UPI002D8049A9|nr:Rieske 2Fe-2S domain-containing protein [Oligoflexus sp.]HET9239071.1 Rieske 2Fe-2S domain-containing protein [Oligoflexus sp.]